MAFNINIGNLDSLLATKNLKTTSGGTIDLKLSKHAETNPELLAYLAANIGKTVKITLDGVLGFADEVYGRDVTLIATARNLKIGTIAINSMRLPFFIGGVAMRQSIDAAPNPNVVTVTVTTGVYTDKKDEDKTWYSFASPDGVAMTTEELDNIQKKAKAAKLDTFTIS